MAKRVGIDELLVAMEERPLFDVRTPAEFAQGHVPGAYNLPLFSNEERAVVGRAYKQVGPDAAMLEGLDFVGPKMRHFVEEARRQAPEGKVAVHCWRGGKRSDSLSWLLEFAGFDVLVLEGGYKAFRRHVLEWFEQETFNLVILGGYTGTGKTEILQRIREMGEQVIDLEGLANHKGSAFGALGEAPQPSVEHFENLLFHEFSRQDRRQRIWLENESRAIGRVYLPDGLWRQMRQAPLIHIEAPQQVRVERLLADYAGYDREELAASFKKIKKRLGGQHLKAALEALERGDYEKAVTIGLHYYDKTYNYGLEQRPAAKVSRLEVDRDDPALAARKAVKRWRAQGTG